MDASVEEIIILFNEILKRLTPVPAFIKQQIKVLKVSEIFSSFILSETYQKGNHHFGINALKHIHYYCTKTNSLSKKLSILQNKYRKIKLNSLVDKIKFLIEILPYAFSMPEDDYSNLKEDHPRKQAIRRMTKTITEPEEIIKAQIQKFMRLHNSTKVALFISESYESSRFRNLLVASNLLYCYFNPKYQKMLLTKCNTKGTIETIKYLWNVLETPLLKGILSFAFQRISVSKFIFIPRSVPLITLPFPLDLHALPQIAFSESTSSSHIPILILSPFSIPTTPNQCNTLIIHIHGGGFIGQSTFSHQSHTRRWANSLNLPIFSIEYRLAPTHPFPAGVDDVWQAYVWLVSQSESQLGIVPSKIVLTGDSAGGNFIVAIALKAIQCGFRVPDGLLAIYPSLNRNQKRMSFGTFISLEENVLHYHFNRMIKEAYVRDEGLIDHYLVSPLWCDGKMLEEFPKIRFMVALDDPLFMDSFRFADRLLEKGRDVGIYEYPNFIHGALSFATPRGIYVFERFYQDTLVLFRELLG